MRRRDFIATIGGAAAASSFACSLSAHAQQRDRVRRVGALLGLSESDPEAQSFFRAFVQELARLGWIDGSNLHIEQRWTNADVNRASAFAKELVASQPDVILAQSTPVTAALKRETSTIPIVFAVVSDPVGAGFVAGLPRPGGNITGFIHLEEAMAGKWLSLLKEIAPRIERAAIMFNPDTAPGGGNYFLGSFEAAARSLMIESIIARVHSDAEIETAIAALGREHGGLVMMPDSFMAVHLRTVLSSTARNRVPAIFERTDFAKAGGLMSYGPSFQDIFRRAAGYVDRILRGAKPIDLPVQLPVKFDLAINLTTAKALGLTVPDTLLVFATDLID
jgi:putative tryptophan/tyrosine transport system substrate-binding protein